VLNTVTAALLAQRELEHRKQRHEKQSADHNQNGAAQPRWRLP
jgi:hypothetical protein